MFAVRKSVFAGHCVFGGRKFGLLRALKLIKNKVTLSILMKLGVFELYADADARSSHLNLNMSTYMQHKIQKNIDLQKL